MREHEYICVRDRKMRGHAYICVRARKMRGHAYICVRGIDYAVFSTIVLGFVNFSQGQSWS
jgi:hypothetical protein